MRKCSKCGHEGEDIDFAWRYDYKADGTRTKAVNNLCKKCQSAASWKSLKNKKETDPVYYFASQTWKTLNQRAVNGKYSSSESIRNSPQMVSYHSKGIELRLTKDELYQFWKSNEDKVKMILSAGETPTIDRIDDNGHYAIDNIQILTRKENIHKSRGYSDNPNIIDKETKKQTNHKRYIASKKENIGVNNEN